MKNKRVFVRKHGSEWIELTHTIIKYRDKIIDPINGKVYRDWEIHNTGFLSNEHPFGIKPLGVSPLETMAFDDYVDEIIKEVYE